MDGNQKPTNGVGDVGSVGNLGSTPTQAFTPPSLTEPSAPLPSLPQAPVQVQPQPQIEPSVAPVAPPQLVTAPTPVTVVDQPVAPAAAPVATLQEQLPAESPEPTEEGGFYRASNDAGTDTPQAVYSDAEPVEWVSNSDAFRAHAGNWRLRMSLMAIIGGALVFLITRSYFSAGAIVVAGILFGVLGSRPPRPIRYRLDGRGIVVGQKQFSYAEFRAFSVSEASPTINLVPLKRFAPVMVLRYDVTMANEIVQTLSTHLPMEAPRHDAVDKLTSRLKI